jgi:hypothetical protein
MRQRQAAAAARRQRTEELFWTGSKECSLCGCTLTIGNPLLPTQPRLIGEAGNDHLVCRTCFERLKDDCQRRSRDTGGRLPMPIVESGVSP